MPTTRNSKTASCARKKPVFNYFINKSNTQPALCAVLRRVESLSGDTHWHVFKRPLNEFLDVTDTVFVRMTLT